MSETTRKLLLAPRVLEEYAYNVTHVISEMEKLSSHLEKKSLLAIANDNSPVPTEPFVSRFDVSLNHYNLFKSISAIPTNF